MDKKSYLEQFTLSEDEIVLSGADDITQVDDATLMARVTAALATIANQGGNGGENTQQTIDAGKAAKAELDRRGTPTNLSDADAAALA